MLAATIKDGAIIVQERPEPVARAGEVLVRVHAAGLNGADIIQRAGHYPPPPGVPADIPGMEFAGEVAGLGDGATRFRLGDRVMGLVGGGAQAELLVVHERMLMSVPDDVDLVTAGGFPETFTTAHDSVFTQCELLAGERLLVHGGAGGVGTAAVQLGRTAGGRVTATVRRPEHREAVTALGANAIEPEGFEEHGPFDVILELVGAINLAENLRALATDGRIGVIGTSAGSKGEIDLGLLMRKRGRIHGSTLRVRPLEEKAMTARALERSVLPLLAAGELTVPIDATYPLLQAAEAYDRFAAGGKFGKIILTTD